MGDFKSALRLGLFAGVMLTFGWFSHTFYIEKMNPTAKPVFSSAPTDKEIERELVRNDIQVTGDQIGLSKEQENEYLTDLEAACDKWQVPLILAHTIASIESNYDPSAVHPPIFVKGKQTRAIGFMGVVYEYNMKALVDAGIVTTRLELTIPKKNFEAGVYIIHRDLEEILSKNTNFSENRIFDELVRKYYGAYNEAYKANIVTKIKAAASTQWIRKVIKTIMLQYKTTNAKVMVDTVKSFSHTTVKGHRPSLTQINVQLAAMSPLGLVPSSFLVHFP